MVRTVRTSLPRVLAGLMVASVLLPLPVHAVDEAQLGRQRSRAEQRQKQVHERLDEARQRLQRTERRQSKTRTKLERVDGRRTELAVELAALDAELHGAEQALQEAEQALARTEQEITRTEDDLERTQADLKRRENLLAARARAAFKHGGVSYAETVLDVQTGRELGVSLQYLRVLLSEDSNQVQEIETLQRRIEHALARLEELRAAQASYRRTREQERDRVTDLVAERRSLKSEVDAQADQHRRVLQELEADQERFAGVIDDLESDSAALERELATIAERGRQLGAGRAATVASAPTSSSGRLQWPVSGNPGSGFGPRVHPIYGTVRMHTGVDFGAGMGAPIVAADDGTVVSAGWLGGYGNAVVIDHGGGMATLYAHQSRLAVSTGQWVTRGQLIGYVGSTGLSTGPHLHFEVRINGQPVDPMPYL